MISKEQFVKCIEALEKQYRHDVNYALSLSSVLEIDCNVYDNSILSNTIIDLLRCSFPKQENHCEIEFYCYFQNFGKTETDNGINIETPEDLYERLIKTYNMKKNLNFGQAIEALKKGERVARKGWNGANMYLYYVPENKYPAQTEIAKNEFKDGFVPYRPYLALKTAQNDIATWSPSTSDALAEDWFILQK